MQGRAILPACALHFSQYIYPYTEFQDDESTFELCCGQNVRWMETITISPQPFLVGGGIKRQTAQQNKNKLYNDVKIDVIEQKFL